MITDWFREADAALTVCDKDGKIIYMNDKARNVFEKYGDHLVGVNLKNCHNENSVQKIENMLGTGQSNIYTIEKNGRKKIIIQLPWTTNQAIEGLLELSVELPEEMPHFNRDATAIKP